MNKDKQYAVMIYSGKAEEGESPAGIELFQFAQICAYCGSEKLGCWTRLNGDGSPIKDEENPICEECMKTEFTKRRFFKTFAEAKKYYTNKFLVDHL